MAGPVAVYATGPAELLQSLGTEYRHELHRFNIDNDPVPAQKW
jgi:hypothetical protein